MRAGRVLFLLAAFYLVLFGGSAYYYQIFAIRVVHHAVVTILLVGWLGWQVRGGRGLPQTPLNLLILVTIIVWFISATFSLDSRVAFESLWFPLTHLTILFILVDLLQQGKQRLIFEAQFLLAAVVVLMAGLQLVSWLFGLGIVPGTQIGWLSVLSSENPLPLVTPQLYMPLGVSTWLAAYTAPLVIMITGWALTVRQRDYRVALWVLAGSVFFILLMTFSRGGIFSIVAGVSIFALLRISQRFKFRQFSFKKALPLLAGLILLLVVGTGGILLISSNAGRAAGDVLRRDLWNTAVVATRNYPVAGVGPGLFGRAHRQYRNSQFVDDRLSSAHNFYLNTAAETGLFGLAVSGGLGLVVLRTWWGLWRRAEGGRKVRLEAAFAALIGIGVQSLFDMFVMTSLALLILLLVAYCITEPGKVVSSPRHLRLAAVGLIVVLLAYGIGLLQSDRAQVAFNRSLNGDIEQARIAHNIDPSLHLYDLQITYLTATSSTDASVSIAEYERVLALEPTWDTGWINLAALREQTGNFEAALNDLERAYAINHSNPAALNWARIAEEHRLADDTAIVDQYIVALGYHNAPGMSDFWWATPLRQQAVEQHLSEEALDIQYRVYTAHDPQHAFSLVPVEPVTAAEWWVKGEYLLTEEKNPNDALVAFSQAISLSRTNGDYYASRARAWIAAQEWERAHRDLDIAQLLSTKWEYPNTIRIHLAAIPEEIYRLRVDALPARGIEQNFEGVLFVGRVAAFEVTSAMRMPGPGSAAMQPWYDLADEYLKTGQVDRAVNVYRAIVNYAPDEALAREQLAQLSPAGPDA